MSGDQTDKELLTPEDRARADFYAVLARLFALAPDAGFLEVLAAAGQAAGGQADSALAHALRALGQAARDAQPEEIADEYGDLFLGVGKPKVVPYGSYYLAGFLHEKPLAELRSDLAALGLSRARGVGETEDHFAALAEVMRHLIIDDVLEPEKRDAEQQRIFHRYLEPWYAAFCEALTGAEEARFYRHAAHFARVFLDLESESFEIEV